MRARILMILLLVTLPSAALAEPENPVWMGVNAAAGGGVGNDGFNLDFFQLGLNAGYGDHFKLDGIVKSTTDEVALQAGYISVVDLPLDMIIRTGLMRSHLGVENARYETQRAFVDAPLALTKFFGPDGHAVVGGDLMLTIPTPWTLRLFGALTAGGGAGQRSAYGTQAVEVEGLRDFSYQLGLENVWEVEDVNITLDLHGVFAPNNTGRTNGTDIFGVALTLGWRPDIEEFGFALETEWFVRRRQIIADVLQDMAGWAQLVLGFDEQWSLAVRYDHTGEVSGKPDVVIDPLDPLDDEARHRIQLNVGWAPMPFARLRLTGSVDLGGPHEDPVFGGYLQLEVGYTTRPAEEN